MFDFVCLFRRELDRKMGASGLQGVSSNSKKDGDENACLMDDVSNKKLCNKEIACNDTFLTSFTRSEKMLETYLVVLGLVLLSPFWLKEMVPVMAPRDSQR